jgi:hypothetical protein
MGNKIHLFLCAAMGLMCSICDIHIADWQYWVMIVLVIAPYYCGKYDGKNDEGGK